MITQTLSVEKLHQEILQLKEYRTMKELIGKNVALFPFDIHKPITRDFYKESRIKFQRELSLDITDKLAEWFVPRLFGWIENQGKIETFYDVLKGLAEAYSQIVKAWAPLFTAYVFTALKISQEYKVNEAWIISRDASPLYLIGLGIKEKIAWKGKIHLVECHRDLFGIPAVFDPKGRKIKTALPFGKLTKELKKLPIFSYLKSLRGNPQKKIAWIETGYHGTLIKKIADLGLLGDPLVFFLSSSNPNIFGYANLLVIYENLKKRSIFEDFTYLLGDQIESLPKFYKNVQIQREKGRFKLRVELVDPLYKFCAVVSYWTLFKESLEIEAEKIDALAEVKKLHQLYLEARKTSKELPYILPECIPGWKDGLNFLRQEFDLGPLLPLRDWWGP